MSSLGIILLISPAFIVLVNTVKNPYINDKKTTTCSWIF